MMFFAGCALLLLIAKCHETGAEKVDEGFKQDLFSMIRSSSHLTPEKSDFSSRKLGTSSGPSIVPERVYPPPGHTSKPSQREPYQHEQHQHHHDDSDFFDDDQEPISVSRRPRELKKPTTVDEDASSNGNAGNELNDSSGSGGAAETSGGVGLLGSDGSGGGDGSSDILANPSSSSGSSGKKEKMSMKKHGHKHKHQHEHFHKHYHKHAKWPTKTKNKKKGGSKKKSKKNKKGSKSKKGGNKKGTKRGMNPEKEPGFGSSSSSDDHDLPMIYVLPPTNEATLGNDGSNTTPSRTGK